jgi:1-phosphofructokinase
MKGRVVTVTLNPMIDKTVTIPSIERGKITRATSVGMVVGGKGINVSRQLHVLGVETMALTFTGGETGGLMRRLLTAEGIPHETVEVRGMTREGLTYREPDGAMTSVFEPQHDVSSEEIRRLVELVERHSRDAAWVVCSGGSPGAAADSTFAGIIASCGARGIPVALDTYGVALRAGIPAGAALIKPNRQEYEETFDVDLADIDDMVEAARGRVAKGVKYCLISDGAGPGVASSADETWIVNPPEVSAVNPTGSGDAMVAGVIYGFLNGWIFEECLKFGTAAASANAAVWDVASVPMETIKGMIPGVVLRRA